MLPVRVFFVKKGAAAYISHLDLQRAVSRALLRTGYGLAFTEGFNPHLKLVFAMPLSLYQESEYEIFDFAVSDNVTYGAVLESLRESFPEDIMPFAAAEPKAKLSTLASASYDIRIKTALAPDALLSLLVPSMMIRKKGKSGISDVDIAPLIRSKEAEAIPGGVLLRVKAACGPSSHLNAAHICEWLGDRIDGYSITRTGLYGADGLPLK